MTKKQIKVMDTSFRDGFQSVYGARVFTKDFLPALESAVAAGIRHFEVGGGARFQSPIFYCNVNAFDMMDTIRYTDGDDINLQTLAKGINVVDLESQQKDTINLHAKMFKKDDMTTIRNFDALNDVNNLIYSGQCIVDNGLNHEVTITMMELPIGCTGAHDVEFYIRVLRSILDAGIPFTSLAFKDASGTSAPKKVYETIKRTREILGADAHIRFHSHETAGTGLQAYIAALDGGADGIDLAMKPVSGGTSQPDIVSMWHALKGTDYDLGIDVEKIIETEEIFKDCMKDYFLPPEAMAVNPMIISSPLPGGALTANTQMMRDNGTMDRFPEVVAAMKEVVEKGGFATSVTPVSQFYFQQAYSNVMFGKWAKITEGYGKMVLGYYGKTPCEPDKEMIAEASKQVELEPTAETVIEINENFDEVLEAVKEIASHYPITLVNSLNPYRIEGQKTGAFEIIEALEDAPDYHFIPVGNAGNITAYWKGYREFFNLKKCSKLPKMMGIQAEGAAAIVKGERIMHPETIATAIRIGNPASWKKAEAARDESKGTIDMVNDEKILEAHSLLASLEGVFCEPASAASVAGLIKLKNEIKPNSKIVCILTGNGLKDPDCAIKNAKSQVQKTSSDIKDIVKLMHL